MNKNELEYAKAQLSAKRFADIFATIRYVISSVAVLAAIWLIFDGLHKVVGSEDAGSIAAIAKVVEALNLGSILGYVWGVGATVAWARERSGKKRAIVQKSKYQKIAEADEANRSSSELTETGDTP